MKLFLKIQPPNEEAVAIGLTEEAIGTTVVKRLSAAKIRNDSIHSSNDADETYLFVEMNVTGPNFYLDIRYCNKVVDSEWGDTSYPHIWKTCDTGKHGGQKYRVLEQVEKYTEEFTTEYFRMN